MKTMVLPNKSPHIFFFAYCSPLQNDSAPLAPYLCLCPGLTPFADYSALSNRHSVNYLFPRLSNILFLSGSLTQLAQPTLVTTSDTHGYLIPHTRTFAFSQIPTSNNGILIWQASQNRHCMINDQKLLGLFCWHFIYKKTGRFRITRVKRLFQNTRDQLRLIGKENMMEHRQNMAHQTTTKKQYNIYLIYIWNFHL